MLSILFGSLSSLKLANNLEASLSKLLLAMSKNRLAFRKFWRLILFMYRTYAKQWFFVFFTFRTPLITSLSVTALKYQLVSERPLVQFVILITGHKVIMHRVFIEFSGIEQGLRALPEQFLHLHHGVPPYSLVLLLQLRYSLNCE